MTMNMMQMVAIMVVCYLVTLTALCIYRKEINVKIANAVFMIVDAAFFMCWTYASYINGWSESGFMAFDNISPFTMTLIPLTVFLSKKARSYCESTIAFLWLGMFVALIVSPQHTYIFSETSEATLGHTTEAASHLIASLYGIYLIISGQVKCNFNSLKQAMIFLFSVIGIGVAANYALRTSNFGMNPYGDYSIYMLDIFSSFEATLIAYLLGVFIVLVAGMQFGNLLYKLVGQDDEAEDENNTDNDLTHEAVTSDETDAVAEARDVVAECEDENAEDPPFDAEGNSKLLG